MPKKQKSSSWQLFWTQQAVDSLSEAWTFLAGRNETSAERMSQKAQQRIASLRDYPYLGPSVPELQDSPLHYRQLLISPWPYRVIYRVDEPNLSIWIIRIHPTRIPLDLDTVHDEEQES